MNETEFFMGATLRICGSLEIETVLADCFIYLKRFIPLERIDVHYLKIRQQKGFVFAMADKGGGRRSNICFEPPAPLWKMISKNLAAGKKMHELRLHNRADQDPVGRESLRILGLKGRYSMVVLRLIIDQQEVGVISFVAKGYDCYTEHHLKLIKLLKKPFAIAISNCRHYFDLRELKNILADDKQYLQDELIGQKSSEVVGAGLGLKPVMEKVSQVGMSETPVLLLGETGVGKEVVANAIHHASARKNGPFIKVNCGAIPETLIDSELFGHEKGAFTGAIEKRRGRFERAHGGSIFLDEVGELSKAAQVRLLRVLQDMQVEPVGGTSAIQVDTRIIAATNRDLETLIQEGRFRRDFFFRLSVFPIQIPPLRDRTCDIPALVQHFIQNKYRKMGFKTYPVLAAGAIEQLNAHDWPGNVRELENAVEKAMVISDGTPLQFTELKPAPRSTGLRRKIDPAPDLRQLDEVVTRHIARVMKICNGKINGHNGAAEILGINPATLRSRMRKLGIPFGHKNRP